MNHKKRNQKVNNPLKDPEKGSYAIEFRCGIIDLSSSDHAFAIGARIF